MKRLTIIALTVCSFAFTANAQFKQAGNENNLQVTFAPFGSNPISLNDGNLTYRRFFSGGTMAVRLGLSIGNTKSIDITQNANDTLLYPTTQLSPDDPFNGFGFDTTYYLLTGFNPELQNESKTSWFSIRPGFEKHFAGTDRLSPYIGFEFYFSSSKTTFKEDTLAIAPYSSGVIYDTAAVFTVSAPWTKYTLTQKSGSKTFGVNLIAGMDYYFTKNLSLGVEFGFGFYSTKYDDIESEYLDTDALVATPTLVRPLDPFSPETSSVTTTNTIKSATPIKGGKDSGFGPNVITKIKLGWLF